MRSTTVILLLAACSGGKDETTPPGPEPTCDDIVAQPLGEIPVEEWPDGLPEALADFGDIGGYYDTTGSEACGGGTISVKLVPRSQEELLIVTEPWAAASTLTCGCVTDPKFGDDTQYEIAALIPQFDFFVETFGDPGIDYQNVPGSGALFSPSAPMSLRECGTKNVDPILGSAYEQFTTIVRIEESGLITGAITLAKADGTNDVCELTDWVLVTPL